MLRTPLHFLLITASFVFSVCAQENERQGVHFRTEIKPELSYQLISTHIDDGYGSYTKTLGALGADIQLALSKSGENIHSLDLNLSWDFPTAGFLGALSSGYSFEHYFALSAPSFALGYEINYSFRLNGRNDNVLFPGTQFGLKFGYEAQKRITFWLTYLVCVEDYTYHINRIAIDPNDLSNTVRELGRDDINEFVVANRFQIGVDYLFH
jgi:hypothetical protein